MQNSCRKFLRNAFALKICGVQYICTNSCLESPTLEAFRGLMTYPFYLMCVKIDTQGPQSILLMNIMTLDVSLPRESFQCFLLIRQRSWLQEFFKRSSNFEHLSNEIKVIMAPNLSLSHFTNKVNSLSGTSSICGDSCSFVRRTDYLEGRWCSSNPEQGRP